MVGGAIGNGTLRGRKSPGARGGGVGGGGRGREGEQEEWQVGGEGETGREGGGISQMDMIDMPGWL